MKVKHNNHEKRFSPSALAYYHTLRDKSVTKCVTNCQPRIFGREVVFLAYAGEKYSTNSYDWNTAPYEERSFAQGKKVEASRHT